ncbi:hypothetical protein B484DRAFT_398885 [Ochromonadaceae sp. CCMP2298]|nr:hypothetical protein B484DRAFT_398885 [Ochromonadaceae sp. CCMP2298]
MAGLTTVCSDARDVQYAWESTGYQYEGFAVVCRPWRRQTSELRTALSIFPRSWARSRRRTSAHARYANVFNSTADKYNLDSAHFIQ